MGVPLTVGKKSEAFCTYDEHLMLLNHGFDNVGRDAWAHKDIDHVLSTENALKRCERAEASVVASKPRQMPATTS
jgi:hypothetical protein